MIAYRKKSALLFVLALAAVVTAAGGVWATEQSRPPTTDVELLKVKIAQATRMLAREGIITSSGHVSARIPGSNTFLLPARRSPGFAEADNLLVLDTEGSVIAGNGTPTSLKPI